MAFLAAGQEQETVANLDLLVMKSWDPSDRSLSEFTMYILCTLQIVFS